MIGQLGLFQNVPCPFFALGHCDRAHCHFSHAAPAPRQQNIPSVSAVPVRSDLAKPKPAIINQHITSNTGLTSLSADKIANIKLPANLTQVMGILNSACSSSGNTTSNAAENAVVGSTNSGVKVEPSVVLDGSVSIKKSTLGLSAAKSLALNAQSKPQLEIPFTAYSNVPFVRDTKDLGLAGAAKVSQKESVFADNAKHSDSAAGASAIKEELNLFSKFDTDMRVPPVAPTNNAPAVADQSAVKDRGKIDSAGPIPGRVGENKVGKHNEGGAKPAGEQPTSQVAPPKATVTQLPWPPNFDFSAISKTLDQKSKIKPADPISSSNLNSVKVEMQQKESIAELKSKLTSVTKHSSLQGDKSSEPPNIVNTKSINETSSGPLTTIISALPLPKLPSVNKSPAKRLAVPAATEMNVSNESMGFDVSGFTDAIESPAFEPIDEPQMTCKSEIVNNEPRAKVPPSATTIPMESAKQSRSNNASPTAGVSKNGSTDVPKMDQEPPSEGQAGDDPGVPSSEIAANLAAVNQAILQLRQTVEKHAMTGSVLPQAEIDSLTARVQKAIADSQQIVPPRASGSSTTPSPEIKTEIIDDEFEDCQSKSNESHSISSAKTAPKPVNKVRKLKKPTSILRKRSSTGALLKASAHQNESGAMSRSTSFYTPTPLKELQDSRPKKKRLTWHPDVKESRIPQFSDDDLSEDNDDDADSRTSTPTEGSSSPSKPSTNAERSQQLFEDEPVRFYTPSPSGSDIMSATRPSSTSPSRRKRSKFRDKAKREMVAEAKALKQIKQEMDDDDDEMDIKVEPKPEPTKMFDQEFGDTQPFDVDFKSEPQDGAADQGVTKGNLIRSGDLFGDDSDDEADVVIIAKPKPSNDELLVRRPQDDRDSLKSAKKAVSSEQDHKKRKRPKSHAIPAEEDSVPLDLGSPLHDAPNAFDLFSVDAVRKKPSSTQQPVAKHAHSSSKHQRSTSQSKPDRPKNTSTDFEPRRVATSSGEGSSRQLNSYVHSKLKLHKTNSGERLLAQKEMMIQQHQQQQQHSPSATATTAHEQERARREKEKRRAEKMKEKAHGLSTAIVVKKKTQPPPPPTGASLPSTSKRHRSHESDHSDDGGDMDLPDVSECEMESAQLPTFGEKRRSPEAIAPDWMPRLDREHTGTEARTLDPVTLKRAAHDSSARGTSSSVMITPAGIVPRPARQPVKGPQDQLRERWLALESEKKMLLERQRQIRDAYADRRNPQGGPGPSTSSSDRTKDLATTYAVKRKAWGYPTDDLEDTQAVKTISKGEKRVAHMPHSVPAPDRQKAPEESRKKEKKPAEPTRPKLPDRPVITDPGSKIALATRQRYLNVIIDEFSRSVSEKKIERAYEQALKEEKTIYDRCHSSKTVYMNAVAMAIKRMRSDTGLKSPTHDFVSEGDRPPKKAKISHSAVLQGKPGATTSFTVHRSGKGTHAPRDESSILYEQLTPYILSSDDLDEHGYPCQDPDKPDVANFANPDLHKLLPVGSRRRICARCGKQFAMPAFNYGEEDDSDADEEQRPIALDTSRFGDELECIYHWGKAWKRKFAGQWDSRYTCCQSDLSGKGCTISSCHVSGEHPADWMAGWVKTESKLGIGSGNGNGSVYALDCEMVYTLAGYELARVTVVDTSGRVVYDSLVRPSTPIIDTNARFSGLQPEDFEKKVGTSGKQLASKEGPKTFPQCQRDLLSLFSTETILIGHSLDSDFCALKLIHERCIDTSLMFPHRLGLPYKRALKTLAVECLKKIIQDEVTGHSSAEDAQTCMELVKWKLKEDNKSGGGGTHVDKSGDNVIVGVDD